MNDEQRAALVEELTKAQHDAWPGVDADFIVNTEAIMPIIDRLLADRTMPDDDAVERAAKAFHNSSATPWWNESHTWDGVHPETYRKEVRDRMRLVLEAAAGTAPEKDIDALLDSVHPKAWIERVTQGWRERGEWAATIAAPTGVWVGTGPTRTGAVLDAVAEARKGASNE